jgi:hypothetical protein
MVFNVEERLVESRGRVLEVARAPRGCAALGFRMNNLHFGVSCMQAPADTGVFRNEIDSQGLQCHVCRNELYQYQKKNGDVELFNSGMLWTRFTMKLKYISRHTCVTL